MTQEQKTEAVILDAYSSSDLSVVTGKVEAHARDLARKLDAVLEAAHPGGQPYPEDGIEARQNWEALNKLYPALCAILEPTP